MEDISRNLISHIVATLVPCPIFLFTTRVSYQNEWWQRPPVTNTGGHFIVRVPYTPFVNVQLQTVRLTYITITF